MLILAALLSIVPPQIGEKEPVEVPVLPQFYRKPNHAPVLSEIRTKVAVTSLQAASDQSVDLPLPNDYSGQTVIAFKVTVKPESRLKDWKVVSRSKGLNVVLHVDLSKERGEAEVSYAAKVLVPGYEVVRTQRKNFKDWLLASDFVQKSDPGVIALGKSLIEGTKERSDFVAKAVLWVAKNHVNQGQSAVNAADARLYGGNSLGRASLCAAILRSQNVPARLIAYAPSWAENFEAEHWLTEYETEDGSWQMVDPFVGLLDPPRNTVCVLDIPSLEEEYISKGQASAGDIPVFSAPSLSPQLKWATLLGQDPVMSIRRIKSFPPPSGSRLMVSAKRRSLKVAEAWSRSQNTWIDDQELSAVIAKGPVNLALYLEGRPTLPDR